MARCFCSFARGKKLLENSGGFRVFRLDRNWKRVGNGKGSGANSISPSTSKSRELDRGRVHHREEGKTLSTRGYVGLV